MKKPAHGGLSGRQKIEAGAAILALPTRDYQRVSACDVDLEAAAAFVTWRYSVRGIGGVLYLVSLEPIGREDALRSVVQHFDRASVLTLEGGAR